MFDRVFAAAYIDNGTRTRVLGRRLLPFSCWHLFLLQVMESPFLEAGEVRLYHLRRAVGACRIAYPNSRTRPPIFFGRMTQKKLEKEVIKFLLHISNYLQRPEYAIIPFNEFSPSRKSGKNPTPPPEIMSLVYDAAVGANVPIADAWNMPIGQAYIAQAMHLRRQGMMVDFMDEKERDFQEKLKAHLAKVGKK